MDVGRSLRLAALLAAAFGAGLGARVALADVVPTLPVPTTSVSVTVPPLPTTTPLPTNPLPTTPTVTTPPLPTTTSTPTTTTTPPPSGSNTTSTPSGGGGSSGGGSAQPSGSPSTSSSQTHSGAGQQPPVTVVPVTVVHTSRPVVVQNGKRGHVHATFAFRLPRAARVTLTVTQVSPACRVAGTISVRGHRGINRVPFTGRLGGRRLPPGTYKISARNRHGGAVLVATVVIVGSRKPSHAQLQTALHSNVCTTQTAGRVLGAAAAGGPQQTRASGAQRQKGSKETSGGVAGASHTQASGYAPTNAKGRVSNPLVLISLAAAVLLLGVAALPHGVIPSPRLTLAVTEHRAIIAAAGAAALAAAIVALAVS